MGTMLLLAGLAALGLVTALVMTGLQGQVEFSQLGVIVLGSLAIAAWWRFRQTALLRRWLPTSGPVVRLDDQALYLCGIRRMTVVPRSLIHSVREHLPRWPLPDQTPHLIIQLHCDTPWGSVIRFFPDRAHPSPHPLLSELRPPTDSNHLCPNATS